MNSNEKISEIESYNFDFNTALDVGYYLSGDWLWEVPCDTGMINEYIKHPYENQNILRELAWWAYNTNGSVSAAVEYLRTIHTLDKVVVCKSRNIFGKRPKSFEKNKQRMLSVLDRIRYKERIRDAILKKCNDGIYFYYFEVNQSGMLKQKYLSDVDIANIVDINELGVNASIMALPVDYCKIVGRKDNSLVIAFDLKYFQQFSNDGELKRRLLTFPKEIQKGWKAYLKSDFNLNSWLVLDNDHTIVDKCKTPDNKPYGIPFAICALDDILYENYFTKTKRTVLDGVNNQIVYEVFPEGKDKGKSSLTQEQQKDQHNIVKDAVLRKKNSGGLAFFSLASGTKLDTIKVDVSLLDEKNQSAIENAVPKSLGIAAALLNGSDNGNYATASLNFEMIAANIYSWIENFMNELNKCINACIIRDKRCVVSCWVMPVTYVNREKFFSEMKTLYAECGGSLQAVIAASGWDVEAYLSLLNEEKDVDFDSLYPPHQSMYTQSSKGGRPSTDSDNPNTVQSKSNNSNANPKPSS